MNRRRILLVALLVALLALALAPHALAAAGGGSGGFGGGGGHGGGRGIALYFIFRLLIDLMIWGHGIGALIVVGLVLLVVAFNYIGPRAGGVWQRQRQEGRAARRLVAKRQRRVELAAAEAAEENEAFAPDVVRTQATALFAAIQAAWDAEDRGRLAHLVAPGLFAEWERRLDDFDRRGWRNHVRVIGEPVVEYVGLSNTARRDRVVVRIEAKLRDYVVDRFGNRIKRAGGLSETVRTREFWTLLRQGDRWILASIEQGAEGEHALREEIVATPWSDDRAMRDEALVEGAVAQAVPQGTKVAEIADLQFEGNARAAALDLSVADGRFAPDVLEVAARRAVAAWAEAVDGQSEALRSMAHPEAISALLHPGDPTGQTRLVVRGPSIKQIRIAALDPAAEPATMTLDIDITGKRYIEDRDTAAAVAGSAWRETSFTERWVLALDGDATQPWRIAAVQEPLARS